VETFKAVSNDRIVDTEAYHQIVVSWSKRGWNGHPKIMIDGSEVSSYQINEAYTGNMAFLDSSNQDTITDWAPVNIGRAYSVGSSGSDQSMSPDWYLDADLDEVILYSTWLLEEEADRLWNHLKEGVQDGDRWYIDDPNVRAVMGKTAMEKNNGEISGDRISDQASGDWQGYLSYFAEWRRDPVSGLFGWIFIPVEYSAVYWENKRGRLDSWLPDDFFDLWGDYGITSTGDFQL
jgi:hypothetical protein